MGILEDIFSYITAGSISGIPTIVWMILPLVVGVVVGYLLHKFLKVAVIIAVIVAIAAYFGYVSLSADSLSGLATKYGPMAVQYGTLLIGILPLGIGFIIGFAVGFLIAK